MNKDQKERLAKLAKSLERVCGYVEKQQKIENWLEDHTLCFNLCNEEIESHVYQTIIDVFDKQITIQKNRLLKYQGEQLMTEYLREFAFCTTYRNIIWKIAAYLERFWIPSQKDALKIRDLALVRWRKTCYLMAADTVRGSILDLIDASRNKEAADKSLIRQFIESLQQLSLELGAEFYKEQFEKPFIQRLKIYYGRESKEYFSTHPIAEYMAKAEERIKEEEGMAGSFFLESTKPLVVEALNESLISDHFDALQRTFEGMLREHNEPEMKTFYFLLSRLADGLSGSAKTFENYLLKEVLTPFIGQQYRLKQKEQVDNLNKFCQEFIAIKRKYSKLVDECFLKNVLFQEAMDKAFSAALNASNETYVEKEKEKTPAKKGKVVKKQKVYKVDRLLANFIDNLFKEKKDLKFTPEETEAFFGDVVKIVAYFTSRDVFFECSKRHLCQRLLSQKRNEDLEASFLNKLKAQFGQNMVRHLQGMLNDVAGEGRENLQKEFEEYLSKNKIGEKIDGITFSARLLKESHWPVFPADKFQLQLYSSAMEKCRSTFEKFYKESKSERKIRWLFNHGEVEIDTSFTPKEKKATKGAKKTTASKSKIKFTVTPFQAQILMLFNQKKEWNGPEIVKVLFPSGSETSKADELLENLFGALGPLVFDAKAPIGLVPTEEDKKAMEEKAGEEPAEEEGAGGEEGGEGEDKKKKKKAKKKKATIEERELTKNDQYFLKDSIDSTVLRVTYAVESRKRADNNQKEVDKYVKKKREFMLDAAMVRVMKARNVIKWAQFQTEVLKLVQKEWSPSPKEMKKRLGSLMERDFIKRSEEDENLLQYIA